MLSVQTVDRFLHRSLTHCNLNISSSPTGTPAPVTEPFLLTFLSHLTSSTADESFPIPNALAAAPILPRRVVAAGAKPPSLQPPVLPKSPIKASPHATHPTTTAAPDLGTVAASQRGPQSFCISDAAPGADAALKHTGAQQQQAVACVGHDCSAPPSQPLRVSKSGFQIVSEAVLSQGLRRRVGSGASSNGLHAGSPPERLNMLDEEDSQAAKFAR